MTSDDPGRTIARRCFWVIWTSSPLPLPGEWRSCFRVGLEWEPCWGLPPLASRTRVRAWFWSKFSLPFLWYVRLAKIKNFRFSQKIVAKHFDIKCWKNFSLVENLKNYLFSWNYLVWIFIIFRIILSTELKVALWLWEWIRVTFGQRRRSCIHFFRSARLGNFSKLILSKTKNDKLKTF